MKTRDEKLDLIRGASALLVMAGHARNFVMVDSEQLISKSVFAKLFYLLTSLHHQAVMVFFVLSGYFVGGSVLGAISKKRFTWSDYATARLSRLWMVLIPALFLTLLLDGIGSNVLPEAYQGAFHKLFNSGPSSLSPSSYGVNTFFYNVFFLQTVVAPVFGTNGPLWSLAYEFWYYVLFPLLACAALTKDTHRSVRIIYIILLAALCFVLPHELLVGGLIWMFGVVVWYFSNKERFSQLSRGWVWTLVGGGVFLVSMLAAKLNMVPYPDLIVGVSFALWMPSLLGAWGFHGWHKKLSFWFSEISFSLYIIHFPIMFLITTVFLRGKLFQLDLMGVIWFLGLNLVSLIISGAFWWLFESRTQVLRKFMKTTIAKFRSS